MRQSKPICLPDKYHFNRHVFISIAAAGLALSAGAASAQTITVTVLTPPSSTQHSQANTVFNGRQAGSYDDGYSHPRLWTGTAASGVTLIEPGPDAGSRVNSLTATHGVGEGYVRIDDFSGYYAALVWDLSTPASTSSAPAVIAPPFGFTAAFGLGGTGLQPVGRVEDGVNGGTAPALWNGANFAFVNLLPSGFTYGTANAGDGVQQVGYVSAPGGNDRAALWSGSAASFVNLHPGPADAGSVAYGVSGGRQCGYHYDGQTGISIACVWQGTAASKVDIHPGHIAGVTQSEARAMFGTAVVGEVSYGSDDMRQDKAALWTSISSTSYVDLHAALPSGSPESQAIGVWSDGSGTIYVVGQAAEPVTWNNYAVMWTITPSTPPCIADFNAFGGVELQDIFEFLNAWFAGCTGSGAPVGSCTKSADINGQNGITLQDIFDFLNAWFAGCP